jgi:hypothetical protein
MRVASLYLTDRCEHCRASLSARQLPFTPGARFGVKLKPSILTTLLECPTRHLYPSNNGTRFDVHAR